MQILYWKINPELEKEAAENYRTDYALKLKDKDPIEIIRQLTFDGVVPNITVRDIEDLFDFVEANFLKNKITGVGLEVGSGPGTFSSVLAKRNGVSRVYGIEICRTITECLAPKVVSHILGENHDKVIATVGSFDEMELPDRSVDFVFDFFSLHHSNDINVTSKELYRVLKPGGFVLCFDKARPDFYTDKDLDELLDTTYAESYNRQFGLPPEQKITRRLNGEREYRHKDWRAAFAGAGFSKFEHYNLAQTSGGNIMSRNIKRFFSLLPIRAQLVINKFLPAPSFGHKFVLSLDNRVFASPANAFRKEISLMIAYR